MNRRDVWSLWHGYYNGYKVGGAPDAFVRKPRMYDCSWRTVGYYLGFQDGEARVQSPPEATLIERAKAIRDAFLKDPESFLPAVLRKDKAS